MPPQLKTKQTKYFLKEIKFYCFLVQKHNILKSEQPLRLLDPVHQLGTPE